MLRNEVTGWAMRWVAATLVASADSMPMGDRDAGYAYHKRPSVCGAMHLCLLWSVFGLRCLSQFRVVAARNGESETACLSLACAPRATLCGYSALAYVHGAGASRLLAFR